MANHVSLPNIGLGVTEHETKNGTQTTTPPISPPTEEQLQMELNDTTDPVDRISIMEKMLAHKRAKVDREIINLFHAYNDYSEHMTALFKLIHKI